MPCFDIHLKYKRLESLNNRHHPYKHFRSEEVFKYVWSHLNKIWSHKKGFIFHHCRNYMSIVESKVLKRCESSSDCGVGEWCTSRNRCKRFIPEGNKCNVFRQIMGDQCPGVSGSSYKSTINEPTLKTTMSYKAIVKQNYR